MIFGKQSQSIRIIWKNIPTATLVISPERIGFCKVMTRCKTCFALQRPKRIIQNLSILRATCLNAKMKIRKNSGNNTPGAIHVHRQDTVRPAHGFPAMEDVSSHQRSPKWRSLRKVDGMHRSIPRTGLCTTDLPRIGGPGRVQGTRELVAHRNYILIYDIAGDLVRILRVLHATRMLIADRSFPLRRNIDGLH